MAVDKAVDSAQLAADLTSVANAIRTKGGTSASLAFPAGFVQAIGDIPSGGGGATIQSGTFTLASNSKTFTVSLNGSVSHFVFYAADYPAGTDGTGWHIVGGFWENNSFMGRMRYNNANDSGNGTGSVAATSSSLTVSNLPYNMLAGKTFYWYGW